MNCYSGMLYAFLVSGMVPIQTEAFRTKTSTTVTWELEAFDSAPVPQFT